MENFLTKICIHFLLSLMICIAMCTNGDTFEIDPGESVLVLKILE